VIEPNEGERDTLPAPPPDSEAPTLRPVTFFPQRHLATSVDQTAPHFPLDADLFDLDD